MRPTTAGTLNLLFQNRGGGSIKKHKNVLTEVLGKLAEPSFSTIAPALAYAQGIAKQVELLNQGAVATVISADETNNGRYFNPLVPTVGYKNM